MLTIIDNKKLQAIIHLSAQAIRDFLQSADPSKFKGEAQMAIRLFQASPSVFSDEKMLVYGKGAVEAINNPIRIEIRGRTVEGAAQMVAKGIWGPEREKAVSQMTLPCRELGIHLKLAGTSSIEFNMEGVDKSLPIYFLQGAFEEVLQEMQYRPGAVINSVESKTVIAADGDGTIYDGPKVGSLPTLAESPVKEALCAYLRAGGIFLLISGNDADRTFKRLIDSLSKDVYSRVLIAANGGAELVCIDSYGKPQPIQAYRKHALDFAGDAQRRQGLNIVYIGDDGANGGNDYPAFKAVGFDHAVLVAREFLDDYDARLKPGYVGGLLQGTRRYLEEYLSRLK
ncbi:MAG: hypothetical protein KGK03_08900 [Candidatus Omnitrophica bacterium]|nr:hypothetical protein [Candidatus Omnitrophota bacterium]MDE2223173.1 hypothetical protein [Candidatus Omnitrophota bacterium]